jgi:hypothetical protein
VVDCEEAKAGTDPYVADTDTDGHTDGDELVDGTDPTDPSSAVSWQPGYVGYPRLVFGAEDVDTLKQRAAAPPYPHDQMLARVRGRALLPPPPPKPDSYDPTYESPRAEIARAKALVALLDDDATAAAEALQIALGLNWHIEEIGLQSPFYSKTDIHAAEALACYCETYDFLRGGGFLDDAELAALEEAVVQLASTLEEQATQGPIALLLMTAQNNHNIKTYASIGIAGITFAHRPEAARWVSRGYTEVLYYLDDFQTTSDGGYAEGVSYLNYGAGEALTLLRAVHRFAQGNDYLYRNFYDTRDEQPEVYSLLPDYALSPHLKAIYEWVLRTQMPGGLSPNVDDSACSPIPSGYLAAFFDAPEFLWHWTMPALELSSQAGIDLAGDTFALLPPGMQPQAPDLPLDEMLFEAGTCIFRDSFLPDSTYLLLLGEHGKIRIHGQGHEHPDAFQVIFAARGERLLIDSGYISWEHKDLVAHADNHNLVLVDGKGPTDSPFLAVGSDTMLSGFSAEGTVRSCVSQTEYQGAELSRIAALTPWDVLVVLDRVSSDKPRNWRLLWHGNGGGQSGGEFQMLTHGAAWQQGNVELSSAVAVLDGEAAFSVTEDYHSFAYGQKLTHSVLNVEAGGKDNAFLSLFFVADEADQGPVPIVLASTDGTALVEVELPDGVLYAAGASGDVPVELATPAGVLWTDAPLTLLHCVAPSNCTPCAIGGTAELGE